MFYNFRTCYSTVSNMRQYGHKYHFKITIFYSTFFLSPLIFNSTFSLSSHCLLSLQPMFSLSFFFKSPSLTLKTTVRRPHRSSRLIVLRTPSFNITVASPINGTPSFYVSVWHSHHPLATLIS